MWKLLCLTLFVCEFVASSKILVVFPMPAKSHGILGDGFVRTLLADGHELTLITPFPQENPPPNLHQVDVSENFKYLDMNSLNLTSVLSQGNSVFTIDVLFFGIFNLTKATVENENVLKLINDPTQQFDLVIAEYMFSELYAGFSAVFNCPYIWSSSMDPHWLVLQLIDERPNPAYHVGFMTSKAPPLDFLDRVQELIIPVLWTAYKYLFISKLENEVYENVFGRAAAIRGHKLAPYDEVIYNASLMFGNSHISMGSAIRLPQNYKPIGGYHIQGNIKALPEDLKKIMESNKNGVIYFSLGSNLKSKDFPESIKKSLLQMFGTLKQTVLWKFEEDFPSLPKNVHILKWAPQESILGHPNCRLFITHGGLLSTTEAIYYGKPIIGIPVFADQFMNVGRAVHRGFAKKVDLSYDMADSLKIAVEKMLNDSKYSEKAVELSFIYHDRLTPPGAELAHWVRHVVATRGAPHLRSPALALPFWQKLYLDLAAALMATALVLYWALRRLCCKIKAAVSAAKKNQ